ncbi:transporter substrate-binding domain-containing protein [Marinobacterium sp. CAU 1594]|nr:transporter substrate-binding domain-containing protein [Marinobacterium arenosum]
MFAAFLVACLVFAGQAQARYYDDVIASGTLRIGVYRDFPPYSFLRDGQPAGVDIEIGRRIAESLGVSLDVHWITPDENLEDDLRNNVWKGHYLDKDPQNSLAPKNLADVMMRVPYDRQYAFKRESTGELVNEMVVLFGPYQRESWRVAFDSRKIDQVSTVAVFQYHPVGVEIDSLPAFYLTSAFAGRMRDNTHHFSNLPAAFEAMRRGEVDAVMGMRAEVDWQLHRAGDGRYRVGENGFPMMGKQKWDIGMAVKHSYRQLGYAVEEVVDRLVRSGQMAEIYRQYGLTYEKPGLYQETL